MAKTEKTMRVLDQFTPEQRAAAERAERCQAEFEASGPNSKRAVWFYDQSDEVKAYLNAEARIGMAYRRALELDESDPDYSNAVMEKVLELLPDYMAMNRPEYHLP